MSIRNVFTIYEIKLLRLKIYVVGVVCIMYNMILIITKKKKKQLLDGLSQD